MIQIRSATISDMPDLIRLLREFQAQAPIVSLSSAEPDLFRLQNVLGNLMTSGVVLVAQSDTQVVGMLLAARIQDVWIPEIHQLREVAWYVSPEWRGSSAGHRLLASYKRIGEHWISTGVVSDVVLTTMVNSPELKLDQRGWAPIETNYIMEIC